MSKATIKIECDILHAQHDVRHEANNQTAFLVRANMAATEGEKQKNLETAAFYGTRKAAAEKHLAQLNALLDAARYHDLSARDNAIDRKWAARLSAT